MPKNKRKPKAPAGSLHPVVRLLARWEDEAAAWIRRSKAPGTTAHVKTQCMAYGMMLAQCLDEMRRATEQNAPGQRPGD